MKDKKIAILLVLIVTFTLLPVNLMTAYADIGDAPDYIYGEEDKGRLFVYWEQVKWDHGYDNDDGLCDYDLDYYEVYCKYPGDSDFQLLKKVDAEDEDYLYWYEDADEEGYLIYVDYYGLYIPMTEKGAYEFKVRCHFYNEWEDSDEFYSPWTYGAYLNLAKPVVKTKTLSSTEVQLSWEAIEGAEDYLVYRSKSLNGKYDYMGNVNLFYGDGATSWIDEGKANTKYYYYVTTCNELGEFAYEGPRSNKVSGITGVLKGKITRLSSSSKKVFLKWTKNGSADGYEIYRSTRSSGGYKKIATIKSNSKVSYTDKGKAVGKKYYYKVKSFKTVDGKKLTSPFSNWKSVRVVK